MDSLLFLLSLIAMGLIMWWIVQNDSAGPGDPTTGVLAMPTPKERAAQAAPTSTAPTRLRRRTRRQAPERRLPPARTRH